MSKKDFSADWLICDEEWSFVERGKLAEAEQRGYRRGVEDAAKVAKTQGVYPHLNVYAGGPEWYQHGQKIAAAILALLEQTSEPGEKK